MLKTERPACRLLTLSELDALRLNMLEASKWMRAELRRRRAMEEQGGGAQRLSKLRAPTIPAEAAAGNSHESSHLHLSRCTTPTSGFGRFASPLISQNSPSRVKRHRWQSPLAEDWCAPPIRRLLKMGVSDNVAPNFGLASSLTMVGDGSSCAIEVCRDLTLGEQSAFFCY